MRLTTRRDDEGRGVVEVLRHPAPRSPTSSGSRSSIHSSPGTPAVLVPDSGCRLSRLKSSKRLGGTLDVRGRVGGHDVPGHAARRGAEVGRVRSPSTWPSDRRGSSAATRRSSRSSERMTWKLSDVFPKDTRVGFELPHLPDDPERDISLASLSGPERLKLNQLRAFALPERARVRRRDLRGGAPAPRGRRVLGRRHARASVAALHVKRGLKHQRLFSLYAAAFERDFGTPCRAPRNTADVANVLLSHSPVAVVLSSLHFTRLNPPLV